MLQRLFAVLVLAVAPLAAAQPNRPQEPQPPFPYAGEEVRFDSAQEGITLAGTITVPDAEEFGEGPFPGVILVTGSGGQDRDETLLGHKPFKLIADTLTRRGIVVLRYDDRGIAGSAVEDITTIQNDTSFDLAKDAEGALARLRAHEKVDRVGLIGHSEGGTIAAILMGQGKLDGPAVLLAGPTVRGSTILSGQMIAGMTAAGMPAEITDELVPLAEKLTEKAAAGAERDEIIDVLVEMGMVQTQGAMTEEVIRNAVTPQSAMFVNPWMRAFMNYDPRGDLAKATAPVLALFGGLDTQVLARDNAPTAEMLLEGWPAGSRVEVIEKANHLFQEAKTGSGLEYEQIEQTMMPEVLELMGDWLVGVFEDAD
ncbi:MAG: alpha/beta hydrolase [Planctomycetota bacterium]